MSAADLHAHMATGQTHVCQCWRITRRDGVTYGFTDHDMPLVFEGTTFLADSGMSARALAASTGMSVNNTEAVGLLRADVIAPADISAGRFDGAEVVNWLVRWDDVDARQVKFRGTIGEITQRAGSFEAELRGLTDALNQPLGRSYLRACSAVLGDQRCRFDTSDSAFFAESAVLSVDDGVLHLALGGFHESWFSHGRLTVLDGAAEGLVAAIKHDRISNSVRAVTLWEPIAGLQTGDRVRLLAGCDKRAETCRVKFDNFLNFQGFPHIPGEDWLVSVPRSGSDADGGSLQG